MKMPQLRILATSFCGRKCLYCRPTGEGIAAINNNTFIDFPNALKICKLYRDKGGKEVKISGGDPVYWPKLVDFVRCLKDEIGFEKIEVITRSPRISEIVHDLVSAGMDVLNFSLDTTDRKTYEIITGQSDFDDLISSIINCVKIVPVKMNAVIMKNINDLEIDALIRFCESTHIRQLKLLDIIDDLQDDEAGNSYRIKELGFGSLKNMYISLSSIRQRIETIARTQKMVYQGGLGHPMNEYVLESGLIVTIKDSDNGAWYGSICNNCCHYPCHDALMALRLTTENSLQLCLLNKDKKISLNGLTEEQIEEAFDRVLEVYNTATFIGK